MAIKRGVLILIIALSTINGAYSQERYLVPIGCTVGIEVKTEGVLVVGLPVPEGSMASPAGSAGILPGDIIIKIGDREVSTAGDLIETVKGLNGGDIAVTFKRGDCIRQYNVKPEVSADGKAQLGLWLRDSVSGIGTVTFYDPETRMFGALGHPISDVDTGILMPLGKGDIFESTVIDVRKGIAGTPGELCGSFNAERKRGNIAVNTENGIFGYARANDAMCKIDGAVPVTGDIQVGGAVILANISEKEVCEYEVEISRVYKNNDKGRSMMLTITDPRLLEKTGGIVQGMSGSPILQNGKFVGAVTHVLINDPTRGYGVSITNMLESAQGDITQNAA